MMVGEILTAHSILVKAFLAFILTGLIVVPLMSRRNPLGFRKASFIYTMIFQALATMIAFSGIVAIFVGKLPWSVSTIVMIVAWAALMYIEIKKYKLIKHANVQKESTFALLRGAFVKIGLLELLLVAMVVVMKVLEFKGILKLS